MTERRDFAVKRGLGKGLGALLPTADKTTGEKLIQCPLSFIDPDDQQPRKRFDPEKLHELADSIKEKGVVQPVLVRAAAQPGRYKLVAGERRWRAAQQAGLDQIPALVLTLDDRQAVEVSLIENLQREDLNAVEEARGYQRLIDEFDFNHEEVAKTLGKDRSTVTNMLRLLHLPTVVLAMLEESKLSMGHGRALLALDSVDQQTALAERIVARQLSVRQVEKLVRDVKQEKMTTSPSSCLYDADLCSRLQQALGTRVALNWKNKNKQQGQLVVDFHNGEELERLIEFFTRTTPLT
ncbi:MAG: ParB/RepB/Spo0J family partition protein [Deltaproteobacteria bacterium]|nr:ParB/RepB/Spo0J family partition protein [Candidatus Anaeroferrophillus wilburensis]MBN2889168.1 ParB/RepB/Spo0J family partition protein [Deltaproteobacteria bacterium]